MLKIICLVTAFLMVKMYGFGKVWFAFPWSYWYRCWLKTLHQLTVTIWKRFVVAGPNELDRGFQCQSYIIQYKRSLFYFVSKGGKKWERRWKRYTIHVLHFSIHPSVISPCIYFSTKKIISKGWANDIKRLKLNVLSFCAAKLDSNLACNDAEGCHFTLAYI